MVRSLVLLLVFLSSTLFAQRPQASAQQAPAPQAGGGQGTAPLMTNADEKPVVTKHEITVGGKKLSYTATTGYMPLKSTQGETDAYMFYVYYTLDGVKDVTKRPLFFAYNGGPGSASVWLHLGALGPRRIKMLDDGNLPPAPYQMEDNPASWIDIADMVFIDPVGTGYSRATKTEIARRYNSVQGDLQSVGEFVRVFLTRNERWLSPLFLVGESYGTFRSAGLAGLLIDQGIAFNGIALISTILSYQTVSFAPSNDIAYALHLPTYTATAWYHKKLSPDLQKDLKKALRESEDYALNGYLPALAKGDRLTVAERKTAVEKIARLTGLDPKIVDENELRVSLGRYQSELLRDKKMIAGRLDGRLIGAAQMASPAGFAEYDPSNSAIRPPYTAAFGNYVHAELAFKTDNVYYILGGGILPWDFNVQNGYAETVDGLRRALARNPHMKIYVGAGYYDFATPYFAAEFNFSHMGLHPSVRNNVKFYYYDAGHMYYIDVPSLNKLKKDMTEFVGWATSGK